MNSPLLSAARDPQATPFDYIVVGSGAGGGPLAARLAEEGCRVLVVEAGSDEISRRQQQNQDATVLQAPLLHGKAVEDPSIAWDFRVRHFADPDTQREDTKHVSDPEAPGTPAINKPRTAALGGCTAHHAMITAYGCDDAWEEIRQLTGDDTWHPDRMRLYFQRIEDCRYRQPFTWIGRLWRRILAFFSAKPVPVLQGEHGARGWLTTTVTDPASALGDHQLLGVLAGAFLGAKRAGIARPEKLAKAIAGAKLDQYLDVNDASMWRSSPEGVRLIPLSVRDGRRHGVRERLLDVAQRFPERLVFATETHVTQLVFDGASECGAPRVIGVKWKSGAHLYRASHGHAQARVTGEGEFYARREVILAGGTFNTPQLLMLSGIGPREHLAEHGIPCRVHLPGVGGNLQDRYEVCVVSELGREFSTLQGVNFDPRDEKDPQLRAWRDADPQVHARSLYGNNGGAVAILKKSRPDLEQPDLFMFAAPAMFRGYYPGWSGDLLKRPLHGAASGDDPTQNDPPDHRNLLSWVILKARTKNKAGTVRLRSADPLATPIVTHHQFAENAPERSPEKAGAIDDLAALAAGVKFARSLNRKLGEREEIDELWPGAGKADDSAGLAQWIKHEAWGHHPCGTCRIGADAWQPNPETLHDRLAVLDSRFRVHGVRGLRVVDASVFPTIPGYFIVTPIYCVSEKAADHLLEDFERYPREFEAAEAAAIDRRRQRASVRDYDEELIGAELTRIALSRLEGAATSSAVASQLEEAAAARKGQLPPDTVGVALSGGGVRSATFSLGVLQGLAHLRRVREIDFLSTVSGGGFAGAFLGRAFHRTFATTQANPAIAVEQMLRNSRSSPLAWLRAQSDYLGTGEEFDDRQTVALYLRNLLTIHFVLGVLALAVLGVARAAAGWIASYGWAPPPAYAWLSPWIALPAAVLLLATLPLAVGYWCAPRAHYDEPYNRASLLAVVALLLTCAYGLSLPLWRPGLLAIVAVAVLAFVWVERARLGSRIPSHALGAGSRPLSPGLVIRNRLTRALGASFGVVAGALLFAAIDSAARKISLAATGPADSQKLIGSAAAFWAIVYGVTTAASPWLRKLKDAARENKSAKARALVGNVLATAMAVLIAGLLLIALDAAVHRIFEISLRVGLFVSGVAAVLSVLVARGFGFVNLSSLHAAYAAKIARTFLGATNPERIDGRPNARWNDVDAAHPEDDMPLHDYHPERSGGPLHLINTCLNETIDFASLRDLRGRRGLALAFGPCGVSVGRRIHGLWVPGQAPALRPFVQDIEQFHPFRSRNGEPQRVESLTLGAWCAVSGAAFSTGTGRGGSRALALLSGLANLRTGYWWNSDPAGTADRREKLPNLWQWIARLPRRLFRVQAMLLCEFLARFRGPRGRLWYVSDGGHFENSGVYELIRRRVPFIVAADASLDASFEFEAFGGLVHLAEVDFGADIAFLTPASPRRAGWDAFAEAGAIPAWIKAWIDPGALGGTADVKAGTHHAALARIRYASGEPPGWLLVLKASLTGDESLDIATYKASEPTFPQQSTLDQSYDEMQWECYRRLGKHIALGVLQPRTALVPAPGVPQPVA